MFVVHHNLIQVNNNILLFISYIRVQQQGAVFKKKTKSTIMVWPTIQLHGCQNTLLCRFITRGHSTTVYGVVTYVNTLSSDLALALMPSSICILFV